MKSLNILEMKKIEQTVMMMTIRHYRRETKPGTIHVPDATTTSKKNNGRQQPSLLSLLGITKPIIQAPMAGVSTPILAAAVSNAGGLGSLGVGAMTAQTARKTIADTRKLTDKPFNVNVFCHRPAISNEMVEREWCQWLAPVFERYGATPPDSLHEIYKSFLADAEMVQVLLEEKPAVVSFHFGLPSAEVINKLRAAGIRLIANATCLEEAREIEKAGLDAIIAQGIEAGGHRGIFNPLARDDQFSTLALTRLLVREVKIPVIATGGVMDGAGIAAVLALGAQAAQLGTAFVACPESSIDEGYRRAILRSGSVRHTILTKAISGRTARSLVNHFTELAETKSSPPVPDYPIAYDAGKALHVAAKAKGEFGYGAQWAGQAATLVRELPAAELVSLLDGELREVMQRLRGVVKEE